MTELALHISDPAWLVRLGPLQSTGELAGLGSLRPRMHRHERTLLARLLAIPEVTEATLTRLYLGNEFCPHLTWTERELLRGLEAAGERGLAATVVIGPLRESRFHDLYGQLSRVAGEGNGVEFAANDWGTLAALADAGLPVHAGRLLDRRKRLPRVTRETQPAGLTDEQDGGAVLQRQLAELRTPQGDLPWGLEWLRSRGVARQDLELTPQGLELAGDGEMRYSLHLPWTTITGGGQCPLEERRAGGGCTRRCRQHLIELHFAGPTMPLVQAGQTVFGLLPGLVSQAARQPRVDRLIIEPVVPF